MKMSAAHLATLRERITPYLKGVPDHLAALRRSPEVRDPAMRVVWDLFHAARMYDVYSYQEFDYKDTHIETAMRKLLAEAGIAL